MDKEQANELFAVMLDVMEFRLIKDKDGYGLIDLQEGNLGDIQSERFNNGAAILDRLDRYIDDYYVSPIEEGINALDDKENLLSSSDTYDNIRTLLKMRENPDGISKEYIDFIKEIDGDLKTMDLVLNYPESVVLENLPKELIEEIHSEKENIMSDSVEKNNDITQGYFRAEEPMYEKDEKGVSVQFLLTMNDDTYEKFAARTLLIENSDYENFAELLDSDDYVNAFVQVYEDGTVTATIGISGSDYYNVSLSESEQEFLRVMVADECNLHCDMTLDEMVLEAKKEFEEPKIIDISNMSETWKKTIEDNRTDVEDNMNKAYRLSMANQLTNISVCMKPNGEIYLFEDFAKYDRVPENVYNGQDMIVAKFSFSENDMERFVKACMSYMTDEQRNWLKEDMAANNVEANDYQAIAELIDKTCLDEFIQEFCDNLAEQYNASEHLKQILEKSEEEIKEEPLEIIVTSYQNNYNFALILNDEVITTNIETLAPYLAAVDTNNFEDIEQFLVENGLAASTKQQLSSGFCDYPIYVFNPEKLMELNAESVYRYEQEAGITPEIREAAIKLYAECKNGFERDERIKERLPEHEDESKTKPKQNKVKNDYGR